MVEGFNVLKMFTSKRNKIPDYGMFSDAGNKAVNDIVVEVMSLPNVFPDEEIKIAEEMLSKLRFKFGEAQDTAVRDNVRNAIISRTLKKAFIQIPSNYNRKRKMRKITKQFLKKYG